MCFRGWFSSSGSPTGGGRPFRDTAICSPGRALPGTPFQQAHGSDLRVALRGWLSVIGRPSSTQVYIAYMPHDPHSFTVCCMLALFSVLTYLYLQLLM